MDVYLFITGFIAGILTKWVISLCKYREKDHTVDSFYHEDSLQGKPLPLKPRIVWEDRKPKKK